MRGKIVPARKNDLFARCQMKILSTQSEHRVTESAVMASEIEALPDRAGYLKLASEPVWMKVEFPVYDLPTGAKPFVAG